MYNRIFPSYNFGAFIMVKMVARFMLHPLCASLHFLQNAFDQGSSCCPLLLTLYHHPSCILEVLYSFFAPCYGHQLAILCKRPLPISYIFSICMELVTCQCNVAPLSAWVVWWVSLFFSSNLFLSPPLF